jgi:hypothetical protein
MAIPTIEELFTKAIEAGMSDAQVQYLRGGLAFDESMVRTALQAAIKTVVKQAAEIDHIAAFMAMVAVPEVKNPDGTIKRAAKLNSDLMAEIQIRLGILNPAMSEYNGKTDQKLKLAISDAGVVLVTKAGKREMTKIERSWADARMALVDYHVEFLYTTNKAESKTAYAWRESDDQGIQILVNGDWLTPTQAGKAATNWASFGAWREWYLATDESGAIVPGKVTDAKGVKFVSIGDWLESLPVKPIKVIAAESAPQT